VSKDLEGVDRGRVGGTTSAFARRDEATSACSVTRPKFEPDTFRVAEQ
jgi:hypothetical protein